ncbi:sodium:proton antiporter NhaD [Francisella philomiragia]|uniref:sodium:proton antiporter NhaD n=1 Tax=Francisella philomiragia TaxID=28110 RepID=UPI0005543DD6|nr:sodium:proton antiporter NhaD [Francisella philomiragia]AJI57760.1 citrate transporter family protein [Francisella philomiragia]MBK2105778.1 sodium:proton antiporter NhaD [Francisella philomiragia]MBK2254578.1 sodium:proton antiporter NhaD [Francisella philomiragia]MBK2267167.1 sodium:proton antiporter NhaD [Francisella philomiragia]MBK2273065.1 sodium:proton antiporter NhaD [Francisella philomiragia]
MFKKLLLIIFTSMLPILSFAEGAKSLSAVSVHAVDQPLAIAAVVVFVIAYLFVMTEDFTKLNKSKPVILAAGIIWTLVAIVGKSVGADNIVHSNFDHIMTEYGELLLFLLVAMAYINLMEDRNVFAKLKSTLLRAGFGYLATFWLTGIIAFFLSAVADNLTTALVMSTVVISIGKDNKKFITMACVNIVVAANAGGAFSPFGDITTLMVWQTGVVKFTEFFAIFVPSLVNFLVPAIIMSFFIPKMESQSIIEEKVELKRGAVPVILLFILTIATAVSFEHLLHLPPSLGMMTGFGYVMIYNYIYGLKIAYENRNPKKHKMPPHAFDIFDKVKEAEWDTLLFFYGILVSVQGLAALGYLGLASQYIYTDMQSIAPSLFSAHTQANTIIGILSAIIDNIPVMFAVLSMNPTMEHAQWLLITLTAGVGGSLLAIGSAAGVAVMGKSKGKYTFMGHLKWTWVIAIGYFASIIVHLLINH